MPPKSPLPQRNGLDPAWLRTDNAQRDRPAKWATLRDWLHERLHMHFDVDQAIEAEQFVLSGGRPVRASDAYTPHTFVWFHRELREEATVPGEVHVLYRDERILVVDKPPFLSTIPRGRHVMQSVVVRMRAELGLPELTPMHRLDRVTSGLLLLATEQRWRGAYQTMFQDGRIQKRYRAIAPLREDLDMPTTVRSHLTKQHGVMHAEVVPGAEPNSESIVELLGALPTSVTPRAFPALASSDPRYQNDAPGETGAEGDGGLPPRLAEYRLTPVTGKTHQLRIHLASLGIPIVGDPLYPVERDVAIDDFSIPLQLLANELSFTDPIDGTERHYVSERKLPL